MKPSLLVVLPPSRCNFYSRGGLSTLVFISDQSDWKQYLGGIELQGMIVEPGSRVNHDNMAYFLTRLRSGNEPYFYLDLYSESMLMDVLDKSWKDWVVSRPKTQDVFEPWIKTICDAAKIPYPWD